MAENESFFRKVVRFVANPATDWTELNSRQEENKDLELEKSELKAMIERKRRNDFVRKREFDMLRRVRREGLSPEQLASLGTSSRLDDSEARPSDNNSPSRPDAVKAKIDAIEQQMVGDAGFNSTRSRPEHLPTLNMPVAPPPLPRGDIGFEFHRTGPGVGPAAGNGNSSKDPPRASAPAPLPVMNLAPSAAPAPVQMGGGLPPLAPLSSVSFDGAGPGPTVPTSATPKAPASNDAAADFSSPFAVEVSEVMHDPELDEAVIAFANADFTQCEEAMQRITGVGGERHQHAETWLVLFDLYRATGQQQRFESLALDYAQQFGWSAPQWYSLPKLVAEAQVDEPPVITDAETTRGNGDVGWLAPPHLDIDAVARLRSQTLQMPLPWVFDWHELERVDAEAAMQLSMLFRLWGGQALEMRWNGGERLFQVLQDSAPTGVRDADPAFWLTRLDALRLANRADQFDEAAIDYCVTYEVSPPSWESTRCKVSISGSSTSTRQPDLSMVSQLSTGFMESMLAEEPAGVEFTHVELSGQLIGDISATLAKLQGELGSAPVISVSCARLIRVDFIAAGDLLNWVLMRRNENRTVHFVDTHRLVALFFGAMGINEHAKVQVRKV